MRLLKTVILAATAGIFVVSTALAQNQGVPTSGGWVPRQAVKPDPSKLRVPGGYKAEVFVSGLDTPSAAVTRPAATRIHISRSTRLKILPSLSAT